MLLGFSGIAQTFEEVGLACILNNYQKENVKIDTVLNNYENYLVKNRYLVKNKKLRLYSFLQTMKEEDAIICTIPLKTYNKITKVEPSAFIDKNCFSDFDHLNPNYLNYKVKFEQLKSRFLSFERDNNLTRSNLGKIYLETFSKEDFNNPYIKAILLLTIAWIAEVDDGLNPIPSTKLLLPIQDKG